MRWEKKLLVLALALVLAAPLGFSRPRQFLEFCGGLAGGLAAWVTGIAVCVGLQELLGRQSVLSPWLSGICGLLLPAFVAAGAGGGVVGTGALLQETGNVTLAFLGGLVGSGVGLFFATQSIRIHGGVPLDDRLDPEGLEDSELEEELARGAIRRVLAVLVLPPTGAAVGATVGYNW